MRPVFNNPELEQQFQKEGYVIIPFLTDEEVAEIKERYFETLSNSGGLIGAEDAGLKDKITYDFTFIDKNIEYKKLVFKIITERFDKYVKKYLADYTPIIANFIRKKTNDGEVPLHQNWAFVDERKCTSVSIWCPLVDSNESNGTLQVVPGTHKRYGEFRGPMVPWELENIKHDIIRKHLIPMNLKAGQAVVLDDSIVHYSAINKTDDLRLAIQLILIPGEEKSIHYHMNPQKSSTNIDVLEVDTDFYMNFNPWKQPENVKVLRRIHYKPFDMSIQSFEKGIFSTRIDEEPEKKSILDKLKAVFN
ncbi:MAG: phytanoyl-CoA dioxygenase family protein [Sphingobacteriales bacterium]|nr:phytanoyl-CoA dioxygenase family protein [Sphingobacteriales bacterium]